jgi:hypothetical protein
MSGIEADEMMGWDGMGWGEISYIVNFMSIKVTVEFLVSTECWLKVRM